MQSPSVPRISSAFIWRRVHSLMGFWLVLYLILHLVTNSQAALWLGDEGSGFVRMVNSLESLPYLHVVEIVLIGIPLLVHGVWGVHRAWSAKNSDLPYERNRAYIWQRLSSWILLFGIIGHVAQMRFAEMPKKVGEQSLVKLDVDGGLSALSQRLGVVLYDAQQIDARHDEALTSFTLKPHQVVAVADSPGKAMLLMVRGTFKSPWVATLYTLFVLAAAFHAFNGFWTFLITWGVLLSYRSQKSAIPICWICIAGLAFLGLAAIWGSFWVAP